MMIENRQHSVGLLDPHRSRLWSRPFDILVRPSPNIKVWIDMTLVLVDRELQFGSRRSIQRLQMFANVLPYRVFLSVR